ncbi:MAG: ankyrin repeat domain-containing protein [Helicobacteraceae bacterium]|jgi:ankyrin repeat protein|nr:ankyrin repeat domain-containing protein [Helicobacteraceae bacterium]
MKKRFITAFKLAFVAALAAALAACAQPSSEKASRGKSSAESAETLNATLIAYYNAARKIETSPETMERYNTALETLIEGKKADPNAEDSAGRTPLLIASQANDRAMVSRLCAAGADANAVAAHNLPLLTLSLQEGALESAKALLECGANPNSAGSPLTIAVLGGITSRDYRVMAIDLLAKGADANRGAIGDHTLLTYAIKTAQSELAVKMAESGATIDAPDDNGKTPLTWALIMRDQKTADALLAKGAKPNTVDVHGYSPIAWAILMDNTAAAMKIAQNPAWQPSNTDRGAIAAEIAKTRTLPDLRAILTGAGGAAKGVGDLPNIIAFADMTFLRIEYLGNEITFKTKDNLRSGYLLHNPPRLVMDFDRAQGVRARSVVIEDGGAFLRVSTGKHSGFYRIVVQLSREFELELRRETGAVSAILK